MTNIKIRGGHIIWNISYNSPYNVISFHCIIIIILNYHRINNNLFMLFGVKREYQNEVLV